MTSTGTPETPTGAGAAPARKRRRGVVIGACVAVAAMLLGILSQFATGGGSSGGEPAAGGNAPAEVSADPDSGTYAELEGLARRDAKDPLAQGRADAPVVMIEYADFKCPFCGKFARDTEPDLVKEYVDKGVLRIEWRNMPIFGADSDAAAHAAWAAGQQGLFWKFHEIAFSEDDNKSKGFPDARIEAIAQEAGIEDLDRFQRDRKSEAAKKAVDRDREEAYGLGATSTPAFLINGRPIAGAQPKEVFTEAIEAAAKQAGKKDTEGGKSGSNGSGGSGGAGE